MMISKPLPQREHLLSIWAKDRLADRETVQWAVGALKEIRSSLGEDTAGLLELLDRWASEDPNLSDEVKRVWRLLHRAASESRYADSWIAIHNIKEKIRNETIHIEDIDRLVEAVRPRLKATELSSWDKNNRESENDRPLHWVRWGFSTSMQRLYQSGIQLKKNEFNAISSDLLSRLIERATSALRDALKLAIDLEWVGGKRDLPNHLVHRVYIPEQELSDSNTDELEERDPDALNNDFAPIIRMTTAALFALVDKNAPAAKLVIASWKFERAGLFVRLLALAGWRSALVDSDSVGTMLVDATSHEFWRWMIFPEIATLRAFRWNDLKGKHKNLLEPRLLLGPDNEAFLSDEEIPPETKLFHRDHELARLVDNNCSVPRKFGRLVARRRATDKEFPRRIPAVERGQEAIRARWVPGGDASIFTDTSMGELLAKLVTANRRSDFGRGNDAEAFGRSQEGKRRILDALTVEPVDRQQISVAWSLLLSYPNEKAQDPEVGRKVVETTARLAFALPRDVFADLSSRLCYWLDSSEEIFPKFEGADQLWLALLPLASSEANRKQSIESDTEEVDLTSAALNEPLGHLLSMFIRRCPSMPAKKKDRPPLPSEFSRPLKKLSGRAKELLANRMSISISYFWLADKLWIERDVMSVMLMDGTAGDRLWEAFAKYGQIPRYEVWSRLQRRVFRSVRSSTLSPEAKRRLAEMSVLVWVWSKDAKSNFELDVGSFRSALSLASDDVRAAAASQFSQLFHSKDGGQIEDEGGEGPVELWPRLGSAFFQEIWPLEPALQSAATANDFAKIPARVGKQYFSEALGVVLPYLLPFEVWAVMTEFQLDPARSESKAIVTTFPEDTLVLLAVCISEHQGHSVYDLKIILDWIVESRPDLEQDYRLRLLRRVT